ncbi:MAG: methyltransferase domain-containing protein, partial [Actinomycetales bacterium]|nr:methyltransferase domain-containing protein [Actinomycetales bacterium]
MLESTWDPGQYARFGDERARPFVDLMARVRADDPAVVVDLGCGSGELTLTLADRWPRASVIGVDHSPQMLTAAREVDALQRVGWVEGDLTDWDPASLGAIPGVVVTNAALQWVPGHLGLIDRVVGALAPGGWFAMQVPDNLDAPSHALMRQV